MLPFARYSMSERVSLFARNLRSLSDKIWKKLYEMTAKTPLQRLQKNDG